MKGATVNAHTFMTRTGNHSTKGSRRGFVNVETGVDCTADLTWEQVRTNLIKQREAMERARALCVGAEFARLGVEMQRVQDALGAHKLLRPERHHDFYSAFYRAACRMLSPAEVERINVAARRLAQDAESAGRPA